MTRHVVDLLGDAEDTARKMARRSGVNGMAAELRLRDHRIVLLHQQVLTSNARIALSRVAGTVERAARKKILLAEPVAHAVRQLIQACGDIAGATGLAESASGLLAALAAKDPPREQYGRHKYLLIASENCSAALASLADGPAYPVDTTSAPFWTGACGYFGSMLAAMSVTLGNEAVIIGRRCAEAKIEGGEVVCEALKSGSHALTQARVRVEVASADLGESGPDVPPRSFSVPGLRGYS